MTKFHTILNDNPASRFCELFYYNPVSAESDSGALLHCFACYESTYYPGVILDAYEHRTFTNYSQVVSGFQELRSPAAGLLTAGMVSIDKFTERKKARTVPLTAPLVRRGVLISNTPLHLQLAEQLFPGDPVIVRPEAPERISAIFDTIFAIAAGHSATAMEGVLFQLLQELHRQRHFAALPIELTRVLNFLRTHLDSPLSLSELARAGGVSERTLTRLFRAGLHRSPAEYAAQLRLEYARSLLAQPRLSLKEIAGLCGFRSAAYFSACFKRRYGTPPGKYDPAREP